MVGPCVFRPRLVRAEFLFQLHFLVPATKISPVPLHGLIPPRRCIARLGSILHPVSLNFQIVRPLDVITVANLSPQEPELTQQSVDTLLHASLLLRYNCTAWRICLSHDICSIRAACYKIPPTVPPSPKVKNYCAVLRHRCKTAVDKRDANYAQHLPRNSISFDR